jgi:hypothetical protein
MKVPIIVYTHSDYSFLWPATIGQLKKYAPDFDIYWIADKPTAPVPDTWTVLLYDDTLCYTDRVNSVIRSVKCDYAIFLHEDWIPIAKIEPTCVDEMVSLMKSRGCEYLMSYSSHTIYEGNFAGYHLDTPYPDHAMYKLIFAYMQPAIWSFSGLCGLFELKLKSASDCEVTGANYTKYLNCFGIQNKHTLNSRQTTNSIFFPHYHAVSHGGWIFVKYPNLEGLMKSYGIDTTQRGIHRYFLPAVTEPYDHTD